MTLAFWILAICVVACLGYAGLICVAWRRYGQAPHPTTVPADPLLDEFMPDYDVVERHHVKIDAPPEIVFAAAGEMNLQRSPIIRAIFAVRSFVLRAGPDATPRPAGLLEQMRSLGWGDLASTPGHEVVVGAVTRPWDPNPTFRALPPASFAGFREAGFVKIAWTLRADARHDDGCDFWTETRAIATDDAARKRFRWYWARFSPGVWLIRYLSLAPLKREAERRARISDWSCARPH